MPEPLQLLAPVRHFLEAPRCAVLSTNGSNGVPHQVVLHYLLADDALLVNGRPARRWPQNLRRDGRASVLIHDAEQPLHWVGIKGVAEVVREGSAAVEDAMTMARRYGEDPDEYADQERVTFRIVPRRVYEYPDEQAQRLRPEDGSRDAREP